MVNGGTTLPKPNFQTMTLTELRQYVLAHRDDQEAWVEFTNKTRPDAVIVSADTPLEEQERIIKELAERTNQ
ncbi:hypothetical protein IQ238_17510 [Pleurocapsales cyanobacterium LEGE 06147]|nr:hypothetical protein [Pleurocapsales cyanobacterium LEGE 06147]